jgi:GNAT superfamily N-acetyltransferase
MPPWLLIFLLCPANRPAQAAGMAVVPVIAPAPVAPGWAGVVAGLSPIVASQSALNPQLIGLNSVLGGITARLAADPIAGLQSMEFVRFMPKKYQDPAAFSAQTEARQVSGLLKGVETTSRALDQEASGLAARLAAGTATPAEADRLTALRENSFYLSPAVKGNVENALARAAAAPALAAAKRISAEQPSRQGEGYDGSDRRAALGGNEPVAGDDSGGASRKRMSLKPYRKPDSRGGNVTTGPVKIRDQAVQLPGRARFSVRAGKPGDVSKVTELIHEAFSIWKEKGLSLGPMHQTDEKTAAHLLGKGYVAENDRGELAGTFSLDEGAARRIGKTKVRFTEGGDVIDFIPLGDGAALPKGRLLVFKKAAVKRDTANSGLGTALYELAEKTARENGYSGMILETVKEAGWLYDWYVRLGFKPIGSYRYPGGSVDTILMIKPFAERR